LAKNNWRVASRVKIETPLVWKVKKNSPVEIYLSKK
jgi:hypothetical protein